MTETTMAYDGKPAATLSEPEAEAELVRLRIFLA